MSECQEMATRVAKHTHNRRTNTHKILCKMAEDYAGNAEATEIRTKTHTIHIKNEKKERRRRKKEN